MTEDIIPLHVLHVLNLDTMGGVETLYLNFLEYAWRHDTAIPLTSITGKKAHPLFQKRMEQLRYTPFYERYIGQVYLPKWFKSVAHFRRWMISAISSTTLSLYWNRIETKKTPTPFLYYEHGAAWNYAHSKAHAKFWQSCIGTIAVSKAASVMLHEKAGLTCPSTILPNPLRPDIHVLGEARTLPTHPLRLGFIGRLLPIKAPALAIHALHELRHAFHVDATLTIAGVGKEKPFLLQEVHRLQLQNQIQFLDVIEDVEHFYDEIDILVIPSIREPLGLVALEASARGVPVVATKVDGLAESVRDTISGVLVQATEPLIIGKAISSGEGLPKLVYDPDKGILVEPKVAKASFIAKAIYEIISTQGRYERLSSGGLELAKERSNFQQYCTDLIHLIHSRGQELAEKSDDTEER